jgi:hypothetical protein
MSFPLFTIDGQKEYEVHEINIMETYIKSSIIGESRSELCHFGYPVAYQIDRNHVAALAA